MFWYILHWEIGLIYDASIAVLIKFVLQNDLNIYICIYVFSISLKFQEHVQQSWLKPTRLCHYDNCKFPAMLPNRDQAICKHQSDSHVTTLYVSYKAFNVKCMTYLIKIHLFVDNFCVIFKTDILKFIFVNEGRHNCMNWFSVLYLSAMTK